MREGVAVEKLRRQASRGFRLDTTDGLYLADEVVIADLTEVEAPSLLRLDIPERMDRIVAKALALLRSWAEGHGPVERAEILADALDAADVLDRRTRIGLVPSDRAKALPRVSG